MTIKITIRGNLRESLKNLTTSHKVVSQRLEENMMQRLDLKSEMLVKIILS